MAEGWTRKVLCRYYANGLCREGDYCRYLHDRSNSQEPALCKFYLRSTCTYGSRCKFSHSQERANTISDQRNGDHRSGATQNLNSPVSISQNSSSYNSSSQTCSNYISNSHNSRNYNSSSQTCSNYISSSQRSSNHSASTRQTGHSPVVENCSNNTVNPSPNHNTSKSSNCASRTSCSGHGRNSGSTNKLSERAGTRLDSCSSRGRNSGSTNKLSERVGTRLDSCNSQVSQRVEDGTSQGMTVKSSNSCSRFTVLRKQGQSTSSDSGYGEDITPSTALREDWVNAPVFVPGSVPKSYAAAVNPNAGQPKPSYSEVTTGAELCPYAMLGECRYGSSCVYIHGVVCELCGQACLHPTDEDQRKIHTNECIKQHERDMEVSFAYARSKDKMCGICMEVVMEKNPKKEQRFGILPNCCHCFCLSCIRKWRQAKHFENRIIRACPECRVTSDFICPSKFWVDLKEEKDKAIKEYKKALSSKPCKYFKEGQGKCPFGNKCFYLHAYPDGTKADVGPPQRQKRTNADGNVDVVQSLILWDFLQEREDRLLFQFEYDDLFDFDFLSDNSDDSDRSSYDSLFD